MPISNLWKSLLVAAAAAAALAGCASTPAPVVNHSFSYNGRPAAAGSATQPATATRSKGAQTSGLNGHANGTLGAAGYTVARGDTLYGIAFSNGMDVRQLAALNNLAPPYTIYPGQVLKLKPAAASVVTAPTTTTTVTTVATVATPAAGATPAAAKSAPTAAPIATATPTTPTAPSPTPTRATEPASPTPPPGATRSVAGITWRWPASGKVISGFHAGDGGDGAGIDIAGRRGDPVRAAASGTVVYSGNGLIGYGELIIIKHNDTYLSAYGHNSKRLVKEGQHVRAGQEIALMGESGAPRVELHFEIRKDGKPVDPVAYLPKR